jgi:hypothetical protein
VRNAHRVVPRPVELAGELRVDLLDEQVDTGFVVSLLTVLDVNRDGSPDGETATRLKIK